MTDTSKEAVMALLSYQQADEEGVMVLASRRAIHEVAAQLAEAQAEVERLVDTNDQTVAERDAARAEVARLQSGAVKVPKAPATAIAKDPDLTQEMVRELLDYDPETGNLFWKMRDKKWFASGGKHHSPATRQIQFNTTFAGKEAFTATNKKGYKHGKLLYRNYQAHRIIWFWVHGYWPVMIDHINGNPSDNRIGNLRECTASENARNVPPRRKGTSIFKGVSWVARDKRWIAQASIHGEKKRIGAFSSELDAAIAHDLAVTDADDDFAKLNFKPDDLTRLAAIETTSADGETVGNLVEALALAVSCAGPGDFWVSEARAALAAFKEGE